MALMSKVILVGCQIEGVPTKAGSLAQMTGMTSVRVMRDSAIQREWNSATAQVSFRDIPLRKAHRQVGRGHQPRSLHPKRSPLVMTRCL